MEWILVTLASVFAGFVDAIVGGGGLILLPALFSAFPTAQPVILLGTNKSASVWGTSFAAWQFKNRVELPWKVILPAAFCGLAGAFLGAWAVTQLAPTYLRKALPVILLMILLYTLAKKDLGQHHAPRWSGRREVCMACIIGGGIGVYDGFWGPGTGSFLVFLFVRVLGYDFLRASAGAKMVNVCTNLAAITLFAMKGYVWWRLGLLMAAANIVGSFWGSRMALKHGTGFVRWVFMAVVACLILKTGYDAFIVG